MLSQLASLACFVLFLGLGARVRARREPLARQRAIHQLLAFVVIVSLTAGVLQQDLWPFTSHTIAVGRPRADSRICLTGFYGVDAHGREWPLDPYSWTPVYGSILQFWVEQRLPRLGVAERQRALDFLLERAERSRARLAAGRPLGPERILGRAGAPYWLLLPRQLRAPEQPYVALRAFTDCWLPAEKVMGHSTPTHTLRFEHRRP